jgi:hypothetical protein
VVELLRDYLLDALAMHATHIAFPDLTFPTIVQLRRFVKTSKDPRTNRTLSQLIEKVGRPARHRAHAPHAWGLPSVVDAYSWSKTAATLSVSALRPTLAPRIRPVRCVACPQSYQ